MLQLRVGLRCIGKTAIAQELALHRAVESLYLALRLRVPDTSVNGQNVPVHEPLLKGRIPVPETGERWAVV